MFKKKQKQKQRDPKKSARSNRQLKRALDIKVEEIEREKLTITLENAERIESKNYGGYNFYINFELNNNFQKANIDDIIGEIIEAILFPDDNENYLKHIDFIKETLNDYNTNYNNQDSDLYKIKEIFRLNMDNINRLKGNIKEFSSENTKQLYKDIFSVKSINNDMFINGNYISIVGTESSKKQRQDDGINIDIDPSKISKGELPTNFDTNIELYKTYIMDYLKFIYILQKEVYDEYIYYITKIVEIHKQIEEIKPYVWEEEYLVNELIRMYNTDILEKLKKYKESSDQEKETLKSEINTSIKLLEDKLAQNKRNIINEDKIVQITENIKAINDGLNSGDLDGKYDISLLQESQTQLEQDPEKLQETQETQKQPQPQPQSSQQSTGTGSVYGDSGITEEDIAGMLGGGKNVRPPRKRTPVKRR